MKCRDERNVAVIVASTGSSREGLSIGPIQYDDTVLREGAAALGLALTEEQLGAFARYYALLMEENEVAGLTTVVEPSAVQGRHFLDSLALGAVLARAGVSLEGASAVDLGSAALASPASRWR